MFGLSGFTCDFGCGFGLFGCLWLSFSIMRFCRDWVFRCCVILDFGLGLRPFGGGEIMFVGLWLECGFLGLTLGFEVLL